MMVNFVRSAMKAIAKAIRGLRITSSRESWVEHMRLITSNEYTARATLAKAEMAKEPLQFDPPYRVARHIPRKCPMCGGRLVGSLRSANILHPTLWYDHFATCGLVVGARPIKDAKPNAKCSTCNEGLAPQSSRPWYMIYDIAGPDEVGGIHAVICKSCYYKRWR